MNILNELSNNYHNNMEKDAAGAINSIAKGFGKLFSNPAMGAQAATTMKGTLNGGLYGGLGGAALGGVAGFFDPGTQQGQGSPGIIDRIKGGVNGAAMGGTIGMMGGAAMGGLRGFNRKIKTSQTAPKTATTAPMSNYDTPLLTWNGPAKTGEYAVKEAAAHITAFVKEAASSGWNRSLKTLANSRNTGALYGALGGGALGFFDPETETNPVTGKRNEPTMMQRLQGGIKGLSYGGLIGGGLGTINGMGKVMGGGSKSSKSRKHNNKGGGNSTQTNAGGNSNQANAGGNSTQTNAGGNSNQANSGGNKPKRFALDKDMYNALVGDSRTSDNSAFIDDIGELIGNAAQRGKYERADLMRIESVLAKIPDGPEKDKLVTTIRKDLFGLDPNNPMADMSKWRAGDPEPLDPIQLGGVFGRPDVDQRINDTVNTVRDNVSDFLGTSPDDPTIDTFIYPYVNSFSKNFPRLSKFLLPPEVRNSASYFASDPELSQIFNINEQNHLFKEAPKKHASYHPIKSYNERLNRISNQVWENL